MQRSALMPLAWVVFVVAWFVPVVDGGKTLHDGVLPGWEAFLEAHWLFLGSTVVNALWAWPSENGLPLRLGYWLWLGSFVLITVAAFGRPRAQAPDTAA